MSRPKKRPPGKPASTSADILTAALSRLLETLPIRNGSSE